jgi:cbb3-type cytochrome oxidase subunit 3
VFPDGSGSLAGGSGKYCKKEWRCSARLAPKRDRSSAVPSTEEKSMAIYHWLIIAAFIGVLIWVFRPKSKTRFEEDSRIPFDDAEDSGDKDSNA